MPDQAVLQDGSYSCIMTVFVTQERDAVINNPVIGALTECVFNEGAAGRAEFLTANEAVKRMTVPYRSSQK